MTAPHQLMTYIDRAGYERACVEIGVDALSDPETATMAETGFERLSVLAWRGAPMSEKAVLATHLRRGYSIHSGHPNGTRIGTRLMD